MPKIKRSDLFDWPIVAVGFILGGAVGLALRVLRLFSESFRTGRDRANNIK